MADTEREQRSRILELVQHYQDLESKAGNLIDKKKCALDWLDNRYVYIIIVLSALIGAAKDKLDSFYDDFQENLIDIHHNQRKECLERRNKLENIQKHAAKKRKLYQEILKRGSSKTLRQVMEKSKSKIEKDSDIVLSEFQVEEFIDYQFDTKEVLKKIILAMITSTDIKLVQAPLKFDNQELPAAVKAGVERSANIEARISSAFGKGIEQHTPQTRDARSDYVTGVLDDDENFNTVDDDEADFDFGEDISDVDEKDIRENDNAEVGESATTDILDDQEEGLPPSYEQVKEGGAENVMTGEVLVANECSDNRTDNCKMSKIAMDCRPNGYSRNTKYVITEGSSNCSCLPNEHMQKTIFEKCGYSPHVGVTLPVKTESSQNANSAKCNNSVKNKNTHLVSCTIECNGNTHSQKFPLDIKPDCPGSTDDDLMINDVLDTIEKTSRADEKIHMPNETSNEKSDICPSGKVIISPEKLPEQGIKRIDNIKPIKLSEVRLQGSRFHSGIFISDNRILFPDYVFEKLKIFDLRGKEINVFTLYRKPWDVACNPKGEIIVSFPNSLCIKRYRMTRNDLIELNSLDLFSYGVDGFDDILGNSYLVVNERSVNILESNGLLCRSIGTSCVEPKVVGSRDGSKFYYTDGNNIMCETKCGKKLCTYAYPINETPIALSLDSTGNLYICCFNSGQISIYKISTSGKHLLIAKLDWTEPDLPRKIVFDYKGEHFFVISHVETPPNLTHVERSRELLVVQPQIMEAGVAEIYKLPCRNFETIL